MRLTLFLVFCAALLAAVVPSAQAAKRNPANYPPQSCAAYRHSPKWFVATSDHSVWKLRSRHDMIHSYAIASRYPACYAVTVVCHRGGRLTWHAKGALMLHSDFDNNQIDISFAGLRRANTCIFRGWLLLRKSNVATMQNDRFTSMIFASRELW